MIFPFKSAELQNGLTGDTNQDYLSLHLEKFVVTLTKSLEVVKSLPSHFGLSFSECSVMTNVNLTPASALVVSVSFKMLA